MFTREECLIIIVFFFFRRLLRFWEIDFFVFLFFFFFDSIFHCYVEEFLLILSLYLHFFSFYSCMPIVEFLSILFSLPPFFFFFSIAEFYTFGENENRNFLSIIRRVGFDGRIDFVAKRGTKWNSSRIKAKRFQIPFPFLERDPRGIKYCTVINFMHVG